MTMKKKQLWILLTIFIFCSCVKDDKLSENPPEIPESVNYDLNDDSVDDIRIRYSLFTWFGTNINGEGISGGLETLNGSSVLSKRYGYTLFNKLNDTIRIEPSDPYYWGEDSYSLLVKNYNYTYGDLWPNEWEIMSDMILDNYYLGIKLKVCDSILLGWIRIKINKFTGGIHVLEKKFTTEEYIVIGK